MADNKTRGRSADRKRLNKGEPYEVAYAKSDRASPARKALLAKSASTGGAAKRAAGSAAKKSGSARSGGAARKGSAAKTPARKSGSGARKSSSASTRGQAKSASPAMKRTNAQPTRGKTPTTRGAPHPPKEEKTVENTAPRTMREADAIDLLTDDHLQVSSLFQRYEKLAKRQAPADDRRELAQAICGMLKAHTRIEEEIFYPAARSAGIDADMLDEAQIEHASAKDLIAQIEGGNPDDDLYDAKVAVLGEYITHHVVEEHTEMFPKLRRAGIDLVALRGELEARKMSINPDAGDSAAKAAEEPGLLAKLSDKLFSSDSGA